MRALDRAAIEEDGVPSLVLMERAGYGVFQRIAEWFAPIAGKRVAVLKGKGNNGGYGMVVARYLHEAGAQVHLWLAHSPGQFHGDTVAHPAGIWGRIGMFPCVGHRARDANGQLCPRQMAALSPP